MPEEREGKGLNFLFFSYIMDKLIDKEGELSDLAIEKIKKGLNDIKNKRVISLERLYKKKGIQNGK